MAIANPYPYPSPTRLRDELRFCEQRMRSASSRAEYEHYRDRLVELEREAMRSYPYFEQPRMPSWNPTELPAPAPEKPNALTFLEKADKKLLLTGTPT